MGIAVYPAPPSGPTLAEITTAITTNAAPASVTNSSIATQVSTYAPSPLAWSIVGSATVSYGSNTVTFSGLSGYKAYKIVIPFINISGAYNGISLKINGDAGSNYQRWGFACTGTQQSLNAGQDTKFILADNGTNNGWFVGDILVEQANTSAHKSITSNFNTSGLSYQYFPYKGLYNTSSSINSLTVQNVGGGTFGNGNTIYLYGAN